MVHDHNQILLLTTESTDHGGHGDHGDHSGHGDHGDHAGQGDHSMHHMMSMVVSK